MPGGVRKNPKFGLIFGNQTNIFNKYVSGSGVGSLNRSVRRALNRNASFSMNLNVKKSPNKPNSYPMIGICSAYPPELITLYNKFNVYNGEFVSTTIKGLRFWKGMYKDKFEILLFRTGTSIVNATYQLQLALDNFPIEKIIFAGVAGGINPNLLIGDIVIPNQWAYHDECDYLNPDNNNGYIISPSQDYYGNYGMIFFDDVKVIREGMSNFEKKEFFNVDEELLAIANNAVKKMEPIYKNNRKITVNIGGNGLSGSVFLDNASYRETIYNIWNANCVDMESTALSHVAWVNKIPIIIIRSLSDLAGGQSGQNQIDENEYTVSEIAIVFLLNFLDELSLTY